MVINNARNQVKTQNDARMAAIFNLISILIINYFENLPH